MLPVAGFIFAGMAVVGFLLIMPASIISDRLGRKWTIVPSCVAIASACLLMAATGVLTLEFLSCRRRDTLASCPIHICSEDLAGSGTTCV